MIGLTIKHIDDETDDCEIIAQVIAKYGFSILQEQGDDMVAAHFGEITLDAVADMDRELIAKIGGHIVCTLS